MSRVCSLSGTGNNQRASGAGLVGVAGGVIGWWLGTGGWSSDRKPPPGGGNKALVALVLVRQTRKSVPVSVTSQLDRFVRYPPLINSNWLINSVK